MNRKDQDGVAPLHLATEGIATTKLLIAHHADVNIRNSNNELPLRSAAEVNYVEAAGYLLDNGSLLELRSTKYKTTPLELAARRGHLNVFELLIERGADVQSSSWSEDNALT